jgi:MFS transporter, PPP family, 3-phenylpropionic acid transporter
LNSARAVNALRLYYLAIYIGLGAVLPLMALSMQARGFRPTQYAWLMALMPLSRMLAPPLWGALSDKWLGTTKLLRMNTVLAGLGMLCLSQSKTFLFTLCAYALWALFGSSLIPLSEAGTYQLLGANASHFGYVRVFGSIGFALSAAAFGLFGVDPMFSVPFVVASAGYLFGSLAVRQMRDVRPTGRVRLRGTVAKLLERPEVVLLWSASTLYYAAHGAFDMYFGPHVARIPGVTPGFVSACWSVGVVFEVALFFVLPRFLRSGSNAGWLIFAAVVACVRWFFLARADSALEVALLAPLHAITFGLWYLVFVHENQQSATDEIRATVQGLGAACLGLGTSSATLLGGYVLEHLGGRQLFELASATAALSGCLYALRGPLSRRLDKRRLAVGSGQT